MKDINKNVEKLEITPKDGVQWFEADATTGEAEDTPAERASNETVHYQEKKQYFKD